MAQTAKLIKSNLIFKVARIILYNVEGRGKW